MTASLPHGTRVSLRHDGDRRTGVICGRAHPIGGSWHYDVRLTTGAILQNIEAEKILRVVKEERVA